MDTFALLRAELAELTWRGPRARVATATALSTALAVYMALWLRLDNAWWAGLSGFACSQASRPASVSRATLRILGTLVGAAAGLAAVAVLIDDHVACLLFLACCGLASILGGNCSPHSYAWLLGGITAGMVVTSSLATPEAAVHVAAYRSAETIVGALAALLVAYVLHDPAAPATAAPAVAWSDALTADSPVMAHAVRTGLALALVPVAWAWLELPGVSQMAVSVAAVMAIPKLGGTAAEDRGAVLLRGTHRVLGCVIGGVAGLALLALPFEALLAWIVLVLAGAWLCAFVNQSKRGVSYVGVQANVAFVVTTMQSWGPPQSLLPAVDRLAGMLGGLAMLLAVLAATWPDASPEAGSGTRSG